MGKVCNKTCKSEGTVESTLTFEGIPILFHESTIFWAVFNKSGVEVSISSEEAEESGLFDNIF